MAPVAVNSSDVRFDAPRALAASSSAARGACAWLTNGNASSRAAIDAMIFRMLDLLMGRLSMSYGVTRLCRENVANTSRVEGARQPKTRAASLHARADYNASRSSECPPRRSIRLIAGEETMRIGFIGLGNMGEPLAGFVLKAGFTLVVHDIRRDAAEGLLRRGAV